MLGQRSVDDAKWFAMDPRTMRAAAFSVVVRTAAGNIPVLGTLASRFGIAFITEKKLDGNELTLTMTIRSRAIPSRVRIVAHDEVKHKGRNVLRYFTQLVGIAADDWDALVRYVDDKPEPPSAVPAPAAADEDFRSLPLQAQQQIVALLVQSRRLTQPRGDAAPLIRFKRIGTRMVDGLAFTDIVVHSRMPVDGQVKGYDTRFRLNPDGRVQVQV